MYVRGIDWELIQVCSFVCRFCSGKFLRVFILIGEGVIDLFIKYGAMVCFLSDREEGTEEVRPFFFTDASCYLSVLSIFSIARAFQISQNLARISVVVVKSFRRGWPAHRRWNW